MEIGGYKVLEAKLGGKVLSQPGHSPKVSEVNLMPGHHTGGWK